MHPIKNVNRCIARADAPAGYVTLQMKRDDTSDEILASTTEQCRVNCFHWSSNLENSVEVIIYLFIESPDLYVNDDAIQADSFVHQ